MKGKKKPLTLIVLSLFLVSAIALVFTAAQTDMPTTSFPDVQVSAFTEVLATQMAIQETIGKMIGLQMRINQLKLENAKLRNAITNLWQDMTAPSDTTTWWGAEATG